MDHSHDGQPRENSTEEVLRRLDKMVAAGRVTEEEAARVRTAASAASGDVDDALRSIRSRHATARVGEAVGDGRLSQEEANVILARLEAGEDPLLLRPLLRGQRRSAAEVDGLANGSEPGHG